MVNIISLFLFQISAFEEPIRSAPMVVIDGNVDEAVVHYAIQLCKKHRIPGGYAIPRLPTAVPNATVALTTLSLNDETISYVIIIIIIIIRIIYIAPIP